MKIVSKIAVATVMILLVVACFMLYQKYADEQRNTLQLKEELTILAKKENRSAVMQSINSQMEEIANQQRLISDAQRLQAEEQTELANEQRRQAEIERQNAQEAEKRAVEASILAKNQQEIAEQQRQAAITSKKIADTLSYNNLGRSLGTFALSQYSLGNTDLAVLLSYASYYYTDKYRGDIYNPAVYQALTKISLSEHTWARHNGKITNVNFLTTNRLVSVSTYGEIMEHELSGENLKSTMVFKNSNFDFRYADIVGDNVYAVSRSGHVVVKTPKGIKIVELKEVYHPKGITKMDDQLLVVGERAIAQIDPKSNTVVRTKKLPFTIDFFNRYDYSPLIFDEQGHAYIVRTLDKLETKEVPVSGRVTAYASSKNTGIEAYGMKDGTIYVVNNAGQITKLEGHRSQISFLKINGKRLYSSSYDRTIKLWMYNMEKVDPIELLSTKSWITYFTFDKKKNNIWTANQDGSLTEEFISVPMMVNKLKSQMTRNFTREEWNYYIGANVPYEKFLEKEVRP